MPATPPLAVCFAAFLAFATASQHVLQDPRASSDETTSISDALFKDLERASRLADIAYCVNPPATDISRPFNCLSRCAEFPSFELVSTWNTGLTMTDCAGFIALNHPKDDGANGEIVVAFRGTYSITNAIIDLSTIPQEYSPYPGRDDEDPEDPDDRCSNCTVHIGFNTAWQMMRERILSELRQINIFYSNYTMTVIGHSLGGAVATLAALDLQTQGYDPVVTTFGEPRVGNQGLADYVDAHFDLDTEQHDLNTRRFRRVTHINDPIPLLPLAEWGFKMHAGEVYIAKPDLSPEVEDLRHCTGDADPHCIAGQDAEGVETVESRSLLSRSAGLLASVKREIWDVQNEPWGIPSRYKLWQLFFAHRDYFHRIGVCIPGGDPFSGDRNYTSAASS